MMMMMMMIVIIIITLLHSYMKPCFKAKLSDSHNYDKNINL
jgi:hypothetical protein